MDESTGDEFNLVSCGERRKRVPVPVTTPIPTVIETRRTKCMSESDVALTGADEDQCVHEHLTGSGTRDQLRLPLKYADTTELVDTNVGYDMQFTKTPISPSIPSNAFINHKSSGRHPNQQHVLSYGVNDDATMARCSDSNGNNRTSTLPRDDSSGVSSCAVSMTEAGQVLARTPAVPAADNTTQCTHRCQHAFIPRHDDELQLEVGDAVNVHRVCADGWCEGTSIRTGQTGIFPSAHVFEVDDLADADDLTQAMGAFNHDTFALKFLGSVEVAHHKGNDVLVQGINKVLSNYQNHEEVIVPKFVVLEINFQGVHMIQKSRGRGMFRAPQFDYFYSLQNISFCGAHPKQFRYFAFISKHPLLPRFACHVFLSSESTQPVVESIGKNEFFSRAFQRAYNEYMAFAHPTEDIYID